MSALVSFRQSFRSCLYKLHLSICRPLRRLALAIIQGREAMLSRSLHHVAFFSIIILANAPVESLASSPVVPSTVSSSPYPSQ